MENNIIKSNEEKALENFKNEIQKLKDAPGMDAPEVLENIYSETTVGFFKKKKIKKFEGQYVQRKGRYITLRGLSEILNKFLNVIINKKDLFVMYLKARYFRYKTDIVISYFNEFLTVRYDIDYEDVLKVDCSNIPKMKEGDLDRYNVIKEEIYDFVSILQLYDKYLQFFKSPIYISDNISLSIENSDILNYVKFNDLSKFSVNLKIGEDSLLECQLKDDQVNILTYSKNKDFNKYLRDNKEDLYDNIFIDEDKISEVISLINLLI